MVIVCDNFTASLRLSNEEEGANLGLKSKGKKTKEKRQRLFVPPTRNTQIIIEEFGLQALINKVISQPLNNHVALSWCHRFFIDAEN